MSRRMTITAALVILGTLPTGALRAADQPRPDPDTGQQETATEKIERATNAAAEKMKSAAQTASKELSDSWITLQTKLGLFADERVSSQDVHVTTRQGVIVLTGKVGTDEARLAAGETAATIGGAKRVENHLVVVSKATQNAVDRKDDQIAQDVEGRIKKDPSLKKADIDVYADKGIVTLTGRAPTLRTSVRASEVAYAVPGVRAVHNVLDVEEQQG